MKYLITGANGFLGRNLRASLEADGHKVFATDNGWRYGEGDCIPTDVTKWEDVRSAFSMTKPDVCVHMAAINGTKNFYKYPSQVLEVGLEGVLNVTKACELQGVKLFVASSAEVYQTTQEKANEQVPFTCPDPLNPRYSYAVSKMATEMVALHSQCQHAVVFRPHNIYGPGAGVDHVIPTFAKQARDLRPGQPFLVRGGAEDTRAFTYIDDFTRGLRVVIDSGENRGIYHIGSEDEITIADLARTILRLVGRETTELTFGDGVLGGPPRRCPDTSKLKAMGWSHTTSLEDGLLKTLEFYK